MLALFGRVPASSGAISSGNATRIRLSEIYQTPQLYDLEHAGNQPDLAFFINLASRWRPARILEIACGNGRLTIPFAKAAASWDGKVTALDCSAEMLASARQKEGAEQIEWIEGDVRQWRAPSTAFDLIVSTCASLSHLLALDDQVAAWRTVYANLNPGGRFVVAELMADLPALAESLQVPPRIRVELDSDHSDSSEQRLLRYKTTRYRADAQRASIHYLYDHFSNAASTANSAERYVSDFEGHVYFPNELRLLFMLAGFSVTDTWGDYSGGPLVHTSRVMIMAGRRD